MFGLHLGALDARLAGFAAVCGPPPFRLDAATAETGGLQRWAQLYGLAPGLGAYVGREAHVPYDVHLLYACFAPRPLLVVSPQLDREAPVTEMVCAGEAARPAFALCGAAGRLEQRRPETSNQFGPELQEIVITWLKQHAGSGA